ncbi:aminotransferase class I/II-fold pyridoxal phosphate-dependent enzyme [Aerococcaceae bacterium DSM 111022]|nr:aminotransferase class I/II-fold pyridoxal phosphate-dependent enzyme [Aerococcaceae bacterium DSM 111022]
MTKPINETIVDLEPSGIRRFFNIANDIPNVLSLGVGEPDFNTPWKASMAGINSIKNGQTFYTANAGMIELRRAIHDYLQVRFQLDYHPETEMIVTIGASEAIDLACRTLITPGDEVLCLDPSYVSYAPTISMAGGIPVPVPLRSEFDFAIQPEDIEQYITDKTKAVILNYPNNPTGAIITPEQTRRIAEVIKKHDLYVITDEIYSELWYSSSPYLSIAAVQDMKERTIYINGFAKAFSMTGWRLGYVCAPDWITEQMLKVHQYVIMAAPTPAQYAGIVALTECMNEVEMMREDYNKRRHYLMKEFNRIGLACFEPKGAFYCFPDVRPFNMTSEQFAIDLLAAEKLAVVPGSAFGDQGEGFLRISYAYSIRQLEKAIERLERFIQTL